LIKQPIHLLLLCFSLSTLFADNIGKVYQYEVSYVRIPLLDMKLTWIEDDSSVHITYDNQLKPFIAFFHPIHNIYRVHFRKDNFAPLSWSKSISEGDMKFQIGAKRSGDEKKVRFTDGTQLDFPESGLTVFSATHYLAGKAADPNFFPTKLPIFIDGELWEATATRYDAVHPHVDHSVGNGETLIQTDLHFVSGKSLLEENDVLTSVIAKEGTRFYLWVNAKGIYTRAQFGTFPKAVVLNLVKE